MSETQKTSLLKPAPPEFYPGTLAYEIARAESFTSEQRVDIAYEALDNALAGGLTKREMARLARRLLHQADMDVLADAVALEADR